MLSETSYLTALAVYCGAAVMIVLCLLWWLRRWSGGWAALVVLLNAALLLTPAYPREGADTVAPALVVAVFQLLTEGVEAASHALRPLGLMCGLAVVLAALLRFTLLRPRKKVRATNRTRQADVEHA